MSSRVSCSSISCATSFGLTGTHIGCDTSNCGACTVLVDGESAKSCTMLAAQRRRTEVKTIEGMADGAALHPLQQAFWDQHGLQCGFCTPGMIMQSAWLLGQQPRPDRGRDPRRDRRQPLPLHRLREHRQVDRAGRRRDAGGRRDPADAPAEPAAAS